jgi:hypothetical protein
MRDKQRRERSRHDCRVCLIATATPRELSPIARARRAYAPDATAPAEWDFRWSSAAVVWVTALSALALARSSQARPGHSLFVRGDRPPGEAGHAELVGGGARLLDEPPALG